MTMNKKLIFLLCGAASALSLFALPAARTVDKEENVYVISDTTGAVDKVIVSGWLKNPEKKATLTDVTDLDNLMNVKGNETFIAGTGNTKVWAADGNDIFYQGTTRKEVPVSIKISYELNGKKVSAQELAGKSGHVVIRFDYSTDVKESVVVDGKRVQLSPAFLVMSGLLLDNENFRNITVSTGKVINDGNRSIVVGIGFPGLQESLGLNRKDFEFPTHVEIAADVTDFSLITMMSLASNEVISNLNLDNVHTGDDLSRLVENLSGELNRGISQLTDGVDQLNDGAHQLNSGARQVRDGMLQLNTGLATLDGNSKMLVDGAMQVFEALLNTANTTFSQKHLKVETLTVENYHAVLEPLAAKLILQKDKQQVYDLIASLDNYKKFYEGIIAYTDGVGQCYSGSSQLAAGTEALASGSATLAEGTDTLAEAVAAIKHGSSQLVEGIASFQDDSLSILDSMDGFDRETLEKLIDAVSESEVVLPRLKATVEVTRKYQSFTGLADGCTGSVRFIYRTSSI